MSPNPQKSGATELARRRYRTDSNQAATVEQLRDIPGCSVAITAMVGDGFSDVVVGRRVSLTWLERTFGDMVPYNFLLELKDGEKAPSRQALTPDEKDFHTAWNGQIVVVNSIETALVACGYARG